MLISLSVLYYQISTHLFNKLSKNAAYSLCMYISKHMQNFWIGRNFIEQLYVEFIFKPKAFKFFSWLIICVCDLNDKYQITLSNFIIENYLEILDGKNCENLNFLVLNKNKTSVHCFV